MTKTTPSAKRPELKEILKDGVKMWGIYDLGKLTEVVFAESYARHLEVKFGHPCKPVIVMEVEG